MVGTAPVRTDLWQALAGRAIGTPLAPDDPGLWQAITHRLNVAKARPSLRPGIEVVAHVTVRGQPYVMLRSPDRQASYVRLAPEEWALAQEMDGNVTVAALVGSFARQTGALAPDRVTRVVADLGANRMLAELPVDAFRRLRRYDRGGSWRVRVGRKLLDAARGRRMVLGDIDALVTFLYRCGGRLLFTRAAAVLATLVALAGIVLFGRAWVHGTSSLFLSSGSYVTGGLVLLLLNAVALLAHELGHALATKHAGRRVPAVGVLLYFGIPSAFVDTTDIWMASRRHRLLATAAGPASALTLAGVAQLVAAADPALAPLAFKLSFAWYLNALFNLNPLMALDGYYLAMDALEIANLRARGIGFVVGLLRGRRPAWRSLDRESRYVAAYGIASVCWTVVFCCLSLRLWRDRISGLVAATWHKGPGGRLLVAAFVAGLFAPVIYGIASVAARRLRRHRDARAAAGTRGAARRLDVLRSGRLGTLPAAVLEQLAAVSLPVVLPAGRTLLAPGAVPAYVHAVGSGLLVARRPDDLPGTVRARAGVGDVIGAGEALAGRAGVLEWRVEDEARLVAVPSERFGEFAAPHLIPPSVDVHAAEAALDASPLAAVSPIARAELVATMRSVDVPPGKQVTVAGLENAVLVGSGVLAGAAGEEHRAGAVLRAAAEDEPVRATTRSRATLWRLPGLAALGATSGPVSGTSPLAGAHGGGGYPPVSPPPVPAAGGDDDADERLWRRTKRALVVLLVLAWLSIGTALPGVTMWPEVGDEVLVILEHGDGNVIDGSRRLHLHDGDAVTVGAGGRIEVGRRSAAALIYDGGARQVLCGGSEATVLAVGTGSGELRLDRGALLANTRPQSPAFAPLRLRVVTARREVHATTTARFGVTPSAVAITDGVVETSDGARVEVGTIKCAGLGGQRNAGTSRGTAPTAASGSSPAFAGGDGTASAWPSTLPGGVPVTSAPAIATTTPATTAPSATTTSGPPATASPTPGPTATRAPSPSPSPSRSPSPSASRSPAPGLAWTCSPTSATVRPGDTARVQCEVTSTGGFTGRVTFSCDNTEASIGCAPSPTEASLTTGGAAAKTVYAVTTATRTPPGDYVLYAVASSADGSIVRRVRLTVTVT